MANPRTRAQRQAFLTQRTVRFFNRYADELESIRQLLRIRLDQLALAYTLEHNLPREAVEVRSRVKSLQSFLNKLDEIDWPMFYYPTEVVSDLIGARVICWFLDDCYGVLGYVRASNQFQMVSRSFRDYILKPKQTGYRSIHLLVDIPYDRVKTLRRRRAVQEDRMRCEIQIRTKLQDAWGEFTHEVHYKVPGGFQPEYETIVAEIANRLAAEDKSALAVRDLLLKETEKKEREGFRSR